MITIKTKKEIEVLREGGKILASVMGEIGRKIRPGITTGKLELIACDLIEKAGGRPSFKGYHSPHDDNSYPTALCTSINNEVVHAPALPSRQLKEGDIIGVDMGMEWPYKKGGKGLYTDMAITFSVGKVDKQALHLMNVTKNSLKLGIEQIKPGNTINDIGRTIEQYVKNEGFAIVRDLVGHGVGYGVHEDPQVPNYEVRDKRFGGIKLKEGMVLAIEPMVNIGSFGIKTLDDDFTIATIDGKLSAHFEHTVAVTEKGHLIVTAL